MGGIPFDINKNNKYDKPYEDMFIAKFVSNKIPMMLVPAQVLKKNTGIHSLEFYIEPSEICSLIQDGAVTLKNKDKQEVQIIVAKEKTMIKK